MAEIFFDFLETRSQDTDSLLCVGLDPHPEQLSEDSADSARDFCLQIIEECAEHAVAFKPNSAFFEAYGPAGFQVLQVIIAAVPKGIPVLLDAKRGDIASTAQAYARAAFGALGAHAVTASPYLGRDSLAPLIEDPTRGAFLLCKTSNAGSADLQDLNVGGEPLYLRVANLATQWNTKGNLGLVVGATYPDVLAAVRDAAPDMWFLSPGIGAQGADLNAALKAGLRADGLGLLVSASRGISTDRHPGTKAKELKEAINEARAAS